MNVLYRTSFLRDLKKQRADYNAIYTLAFETLPTTNTLQELPQVKALTGHSGRYRIRLGNYRIGLEVTANTIELVRVLHRRDFYRYFP